MIRVTPGPGLFVLRSPRDLAKARAGGMTEDEARRDLDALQDQITALKVALGLLIGTLRSKGVAGAELEWWLLSAASQAQRRAPTLNAGEWEATISLILTAARSVAPEAGDADHPPPPD